MACAPRIECAGFRSPWIIQNLETRTAGSRSQYHLVDMAKVCVLSSMEQITIPFQGFIHCPGYDIDSPSKGHIAVKAIITSAGRTRSPALVLTMIARWAALRRPCCTLMVFFRFTVLVIGVLFCRIDHLETEKEQLCQLGHGQLIGRLIRRMISWVARWEHLIPRICQ